MASETCTVSHTRLYRAIFDAGYGEAGENAAPPENVIHQMVITEAYRAAVDEIMEFNA